jgi:predicted MFS family arabinose efflux permease
VFARQVFHGGDVGFGFLMACRGVGALIGPFLGHRLAGRDHVRLIPTIAAALAVFGVGYMALGAMPTLWLAGLSILVAHLGGGAQWVLSSYGIQRLVPDRIRGRVFAFDFALITLSLGTSSLVVSTLADHIGARPAVLLAGGVAVAWAGIWWLLTRTVRREPLFREPDVAVLELERPPLGAE